MAWDWEKLQQQKRSRPAGPPPQMDEILGRLKVIKGQFGGAWIIAAALVILLLGYSMVYTVAVDEVGSFRDSENISGPPHPVFTLNCPQASKRSRR